MSVLCADIGTSSLKTALIDSQGRVLAKCRVSFSKVQGGLFHGDDWMQSLAAATSSLLA